jgi:hypothetical protein
MKNNIELVFLKWGITNSFLGLAKNSDLPKSASQVAKIAASCYLVWLMVVLKFRLEDNNANPISIRKY